jgi:soluble lytic murein transglycosylase-like protein
LVRQAALVLSAFALSSTTPASADATALGCEGALSQLASAQRQKFRLATDACAARAEPSSGAVGSDTGARRPAPAPRVADALVTTDIPPAPSAAALHEPHARHLEVFERPAAAATQTRSAARPASTLRAMQLAPDVDATARRHDIDPLLLHAIAHVESRHNTAARSPAGALGVMQVMPATAQRFGVGAARALQEPRTNLDVSASYLKTLQQRFGNDLTLVLAAYNAGEGAVEKYGRRIPPYAETRSYVRQVLDHYRMLTAVAQRSTGSRRSDL